MKGKVLYYKGVMRMKISVDGKEILDSGDVFVRLIL